MASKGRLSLLCCGVRGDTTMHLIAMSLGHGEIDSEQRTMFEGGRRSCCVETSSWAPAATEEAASTSRRPNKISESFDIPTTTTTATPGAASIFS